MFQLLRRFLVLVLVLAFAHSGTGLADTAIDPVGSYTAEGSTVAGTVDYTGRVEIAKRGAGYALAWQLNQGDTYAGVALFEDNLLGAVYWPTNKSSRNFGIVVYRIDGGTLTGTWAPAGAAVDVAGRETLEGSSGLDGRYEITLGQQPNGGGKYTGSVEIKRTGDTYDLRWYLPGPSYIGRGIRVGDLLVVGYAPQQAPGVVAYCMSNGGGDGVWSFGDSRKLGQETLSRKGSTEGNGALTACSGQGI